jgi:hypothetical protein
MRCASFSLAVAETAKNFRPSPTVFAIGKKGYFPASESAGSPSIFNEGREKGETLAGFGNVVCGLIFEGKNPARNMKLVAAFHEAVASSRRARAPLKPMTW